ncbi:VCBS repeat-containing protein [Streptomyces sp. SCA3-4]|uniref:FG-GAP repeat domain-containing protein n=1 Tax=Streptomyces sichuanensis TaxID=2871810 RepID=UPI001CE3862E|nr:VCBS repeat-containing protein [Streptomyces sichuanensis]MCA6094000.1 VCBS repeat-containing protein [Streptomyces sichuanensis]
MPNVPGRQSGRIASTLVTAAIAAALVGATAGTAAADGPASSPAAKALEKSAAQPQAAPQAAPRAALRAANGPTAEAPQFPLMAVDTYGLLYRYTSNGQGGFGDDWFIDGGWNFPDATAVDHNRDGQWDAWYVRHNDGRLEYTGEGVHWIGGGWNVYDRILSPGDLAGSGESDLIARDKSGVLWLYQAREDGTLSDRYRVGPGWDVYTDIAGRGDLNGDGKPDIVAKDKSGVLWFYKGTGDYKDPFESRVKVGGGWNAYDKLVSVGDMDNDGRSDMLARDRSGVLWFYKGNGNATDPFDNRTKIGGGWDKYVLMF